MGLMEPRTPYNTTHDSESDQEAVVIRRADVSDFNPNNILPESEDVLIEIASWLRPTAFDGDGSEYRKHLSFHLAGTGDWVFSTPVYQQWQEGKDPGILWVRGAPGSGKSVLAAAMAERLSQEECPVLYFFCRHTIAANHGAEAALRDWLAQVLKFSPPLQVELKKVTKALSSEAGVEALSLAELFSLLRTALAHLPKAYILVDALDEMDQEALVPFLQHFYELGKWRPTEVKLLMTSRPVAVVEKIVRSVKVLDVRLDKKRVESDIAAYVQHRLASSSIPTDSRPRVAETIMARCDGLFLYARLAMDRVLERPSEHLDESLRAIPAGLSVVYSNILREQSKRPDIPAGLQQLVLQIVTHATRPLRLLELAHLTNVTQDMGNLGTTKSLMRSVCGPLLEILPDETVHVVHHSLTEFLNGAVREGEQSSYLVFEAGPTHNRLALLCISYLKSGCLDHVVIKPVKLGRARHLAKKQALPPFTRYATSNWYVHARKAASAGHDPSEVNKQIHELLVGDNLERLGLLAEASEECGFSPLGLATSFKLESFAREVLHLAKQKPGQDEGIKEAALRHAAKNGDVSLVQLLLEYGADPNTYDSEGESALHLAVRRGQHKVVTVMTAAGVNPFISRGENKRMRDHMGSAPDRASPTQYALRGGSFEMVSIFVPYLTTPKLLNWALGIAIARKSQELVELFVRQNMVDINSKTGGTTPLYQACTNRDSSSIEFLLKFGADPNILHNDYDRRSDVGRNALHALADPSYTVRSAGGEAVAAEDVKKCFKLVLDAGAKLDQLDRDHCTPLLVAKDPIAVECLLEAGADPSVTNRFGDTLLHTTYDMNIVRLLAPMIDTDTKTQRHGLTPLLSVLKDQYANVQPQLSKANSLLDLGADVHAVDDLGNGTVHLTAAKSALGDGGLLFLQRLLASGANVNLSNKKGQTPLHFSLPGAGSGRYGNMKQDMQLVEVLLAAGANLEAEDDQGQTPLFQLINSNGNYNNEEKFKVCSALVAAGARVDTTDLEGRNLLHCVMKSGRGSNGLDKFLISNGVDPQKTDKKGNTLWHMAASRLAKVTPRLDIVSELLAMGIDPERPNSDGQTPLHLVVREHPSAFREATGTRNGRAENADNAAFFDQFVSLVKNVDCADNSGITPLHVASTFSEYLTRRLLEEGADIEKITHEGLTVLHLATRSRQTNTLGILLAWLGLKVDEATAKGMLNAKDCMGRSALYYACASGRVETLQMLLEAGAIVDTDSYSGSPWDGCVEFENAEQEAKWRWSPAGIRDLDDEPDAAGVLISDPIRLKLDLKGGTCYSTFPFSMQRLDEIIDLLIAHGPSSGSRFVEQAISLAAERKFDHATECLLRARERLGKTGAYPLDEETTTRLLKRTEAVIPEYSQRGGRAAELMHSRQYSLARREILQNVESLLSEDKLHSDVSMSRGTILHYLVDGGFANMIDNVARPEAVHAIRTREDHSYPSAPPLLIRACQSDSWNMNVIRLLVEKKGADLNVSASTLRAVGFGSVNRTQGPTALHVLARGGHWWQTEVALPYLLGKGADTGARDERGITPLSAALEAIAGPQFNINTVKTLLKFGADPNVADNNGQTSLALVGANREVYQLLIQHGAIVSPSTMVDVIQRGDTALLEDILASGVDPNLREPGKEVPAWTSPDGRSHRSSRQDPNRPLEHYPLDLVAGREARNESAKGVPEKMVKLLLDYGANPSARYEKTTVMHRVIQNSRVVRDYLEGKSQILQMLLKHPSLEMEARDSCGMTIFLFPGKDLLIPMLIDLGADVRALSSRLHYAMSHSPDIRSLIAAAPELVHAVDDEGKTPLHVAFENSATLADATLIDTLIEAGSDVLALVKSTGDTLLHLLFRDTWTVDPHGEVQVGQDHGADYKDAEDEKMKPKSLLHRLIDMGLGVNARNKAGETPIFAFFQHGVVEAELDLPALPRRPTAQQMAEDSFARAAVLEQAALEKEHVVWQLFDDMGVDWAVVNNKGETLLHVVAAADERDHYDTAPARRVARFQFLMGKGLDPMQEDRDHRTTLDVAAAHEREEILALFKTS
ncbi:ankyrin [Thozetella sp. PMI_491]|nr:ankyrin [Thozetella sp. PMI_491]